jgi:four helix bundle protein
MRNSQKSEESLDNAGQPLESGITKASDNRPEITYEIKVQDAPKIDSIRERSFAFAVRIVKLCGFLEKKSDVGKPVINQLSNLEHQLAQNLEEAVAGQSKADFIHKNSISLKEARESNFWLRLVLATTNFDESIKAGIQELEEESMALSRIIGKIIVTSKK